MDEHFRTAPFEQNLPVLMGLLGIWNTNFFGAADGRGAALRAVPEALSRLPPAADDGEQRQARDARRRRRSTYETGPIYWGEPGTNGQHSFYQLIHQGTRLIPCDFIAFAETLNPLGQHHDLLMANVFAQARGAGLRQDAPRRCKAEGTPDWLVPHRTFEGNRPSNTILLERLTPAALGKLVALYEHSVFTQGVDLGHRLVRPVGRGAGQGAGAADHPGARERRTSRR